MRHIVMILGVVLSVFTINAQNNNVDALLAAGVNDAQRFANDYLAPGTNGIMYSLNSNWFNSAEVKPLAGFEISLIASAATVKDEQKAFLLNASDYENIRFKDGSMSKNVASVLGENSPEVVVEVTYDDPIFGEQTTDITLPDGLGSTNVNVLPTAYLQAAVGLIKNTEIKARFVPKIKTNDVAVGLYGVGLQHEISNWLPADKLLPVAVSALVAYTHLDASYDFTESSGIDGENQRIDTDVNTWLFQLIASTKLPIINVYGGVGYLNGKSNTDLLGTYRVRNGALTSQDIVDPFSVTSKSSGVRGTIGAKLKLAFFRLNAEYNIAKFNSYSLGLTIGLR